MSTPKRATVYFDPNMVSRAVKRALAEDAEDLAAFHERKREPNQDFEKFVKALKRRRKLSGPHQGVRGPTATGVRSHNPTFGPSG